MATLTRQLAANQGVTEELKSRNQMEWVQRMNSIQARVREMVNDELICN